MKTLYKVQQHGYGSRGLWPVVSLVKTPTSFTVCRYSSRGHSFSGAALNRLPRHPGMCGHGRSFENRHPAPIPLLRVVQWTTRSTKISVRFILFYNWKKMLISLWCFFFHLLPSKEQVYLASQAVGSVATRLISLHTMATYMIWCQKSQDKANVSQAKISVLTSWGST